MRFWAVCLAGACLAMGSATSVSAEDVKSRSAEGQPSARQMHLSRRYVELMQGEQMEATIRELVIGEATRDETTRAMPQEDRDFLVDLSSELASELLPQMMEQLVPVYARTFSEAELSALVEFYDSDLGRSIVVKTLTSMHEADEAMMSVMPAMMEKMAARMCAHFGCTPEELEEMGEMMGGLSPSAAPARTK